MLDKAAARHTKISRCTAYIRGNNSLHTVSGISIVEWLIIPHHIESADLTVRVDVISGQNITIPGRRQSWNWAGINMAIRQKNCSSLASLAPAANQARFIFCGRFWKRQDSLLARFQPLIFILPEKKNWMIKRWPCWGKCRFKNICVKWRTNTVMLQLLKWHALLDS